MPHAPRAGAAVAAAAALLVAAAPAAAQTARPVPAFGGLELRIGAAGAEQADIGFAVGADLGIGAVGTERLQLLLGASLFTADADRREGGTSITGGYLVAGPHAGLRLDLPAADRLTPYLVARAGAHWVRAGDVPHAATRDRLEGTHLGVGAGAGLAYAFGVLRTTRAVVEARRVQAGPVDHWAVEMGLRFAPRRDDEDEQAAARARADADRRRIAGEPRGGRPAPAAGVPVALLDDLAGVQRTSSRLPVLLETARGVELPLAAEAFVPRGAELEPVARAELARLAAALARHPAHTVLVEAHAGDGVTDDATRARALARAEAVRRVLVAGGVAERRLTTRGVAVPAAGRRAPVTIVVER